MILSFMFVLKKFVNRNVILFESVPELSGSPWMIYKELLRRGYGEKYKLIWCVDSSFDTPRNVSCVPFFGEKKLFQLIKTLLYRISARAIVENNRSIEKRNDLTFRLHAQHGAPLKRCFSYTYSIGKPDAILSLSEKTVQLEQKIFPSAKDNLVVLGYPSNDQLFEKKDLYDNGFWYSLNKNKNRYYKVVGWLPTFRQHRKTSSTDSQLVFPYGVPLLKSLEELDALNVFLKNKNILLAIQMHHAQAQNFPIRTYSNIVIIPPELKRQLNVSTANLMQSFDALITDYSGAYHEYLLLNRPIALSIDDYEEYSKNPGFSLDYFDWIKGVYLKNTSDLINFIEDVSNGVDSAKFERESSMRRFHKYVDNQSTKRVVDFLVKQAKL